MSSLRGPSGLRHTWQRNVVRETFAIMVKGLNENSQKPLPSVGKGFFIFIGGIFIVNQMDEWIKNR